MTLGGAAEYSGPLQQLMCGGGTLLHTSRPSAMKMDEETILLDEMLVVSGEIKVGSDIIVIAYSCIV